MVMTSHRTMVMVVVVVVMTWCSSLVAATTSTNSTQRSIDDERGGREGDTGGGGGGGGGDDMGEEEEIITDENSTCMEGEIGCVCYYEEYYEDEEEETDEEGRRRTEEEEPNRYTLRNSLNELETAEKTEKERGKDGLQWTLERGVQGNSNKEWQENREPGDGRGKRIGRKGVEEQEEEARGLPTQEDKQEDAKSRQKRFLFLTPDRGLALPPGSSLIITPTFSLPLRRYPPDVFSSAFRNATSASMTVSIPFTIGFDDLGLTSDLNRFGILSLFKKRRRKRRKRRAARRGGLRYDDEEEEEEGNAITPGGDRPAMYGAVEGILGRVGVPGKPCLLRAVCEMFQAPLLNHGLLGEFLDLFLSPSRSPPHEKSRLETYLEAERAGRTTGDCTAYHAACPKPLFTDPGPILEGEFEEDEEDAAQRQDTCELPGTRYK
ncbi:uncharacterized protein LOC126981870 [Eriocheir sinensis]|uniref:uncharacterized protein LOC126981870 n=1 Tax=Eriocheir sinensis TaxID=95602 RepID=UPI0021C58BC0|nr:uncharacterized protein LOC126981870 [Eriocheir sinensis]XP_050689420.1 uncharacterized protein LOC126981870 [Eriocheir sinensis]